MVGETLRSEREKRNLTIEDIEKETSIRKGYLEALEKGDYASMPGDVYIRGFIRNYSKFLEIDGDALLAEFAAERGAAASQPQPADKQDDKAEKPLNINDLNSKRDNIHIKVKKSKSSDKGSSSAFSSGDDFRNRVSNSGGYGKKILMGLVALVVVFLGGVYIAFSDEDSAPPAKPDTTQAPVANKADADAKDKKDAPVAADEFKVEVVLTDRCWMQVIVDDAVAFEGTAESGLSMDWSPKKDVKITAGNAGAVELLINGKSQGQMGSIGQVAERHITKDTPVADNKKSSGSSETRSSVQERSVGTEQSSAAEVYHPTSYEQSYQEPVTQQEVVVEEPPAVEPEPQELSTPVEEAPAPGADVAKSAQ